MQFMVAALKIFWENRFTSKQNQGQSSPGLPVQATRTALLQHSPLVTPAGDNGSHNFIHVLSYNYMHHFSSTRDEKSTIFPLSNAHRNRVEPIHAYKRAYRCNTHACTFTGTHVRIACIMHTHLPTYPHTHTLLLFFFTPCPLRTLGRI